MFPLDLQKLDFQHPHGVVIPQARVEVLLEEHARELGVEIQRGHDVIGICQDTEGVKADVKTELESVQFTARYLVGCDGGHSVVRKQLDVAFPGLDPTIVGRMGDVKLSSEALELLKDGVPELGDANSASPERKLVISPSFVWGPTLIALQLSNGTKEPSIVTHLWISVNCKQRSAA